MTPEEREAILRDAEMLLDGVFASLDFIPTEKIIEELRATGNPIYAGRTDNGLAQLIRNAIGGRGRRMMRSGELKMGYRPSDIRSAYRGPECCRPGSPAYEYRHRVIESVSGAATNHACAHCDGRADVWATVHGSCPEHPVAGGYLPLCSTCHRIYDSQPQRAAGKRATPATSVGIALRRIARTMDELALQLRDLATEIEKRPQEHIAGVSLRDDSYDEPEMSIVTPPCERDHDAPKTGQKRRRKDSLPAVERKFLREEALR